MESLGRFLSQHLAWFWPVLASCVALLVLLIVISFPAYYIVFPMASLPESLRPRFAGMKTFSKNSAMVISPFGAMGSNGRDAAIACDCLTVHCRFLRLDMQRR